nr:MAG TPA: hypothetical protein [Caudoviricetes sp.]
MSHKNLRRVRGADDKVDSRVLYTRSHKAPLILKPNRPFLNDQ